VFEILIFVFYEFITVNSLRADRVKIQFYPLGVVKGVGVANVSFSKVISRQTSKGDIPKTFITLPTFAVISQHTEN
jgi:hypothetical protein